MISFNTGKVSFGNLENILIPTPTSDIQQFIVDSWGILLPCHPLSCERDELFLIGEEHTERYILRLTNPADSHEIIMMQVSAVNWIEQNGPHLPVPGVLPTLSGLKIVPVKLGENPVRMACLTTFLSGELLATIPATSIQMQNIGRVLAELDVALAGFDHKGAHRELAWDLAQAEKCRSMLPSKESTHSESRWKLVRNGFDSFVNEVQPRLRAMRHQVIHADFNPYNILMDVRDSNKVSGILDFGDMVYSQLINNIAIAASYQISSETSLKSVTDMVSSYHNMLPLEPEEIDLLYDLIITRLCMAVTISEYRAKQRPENSKYILKNTATAWRGLERLSTISRKEANTIFRHACQFPPRS
ncbi:phosphotransferase [Pantoea cypripedii]|uniref:Hydroxylysine kinase n=1 Tax=Pantoea cypripedii TaxID=55209 RepID=A0A6B9G7T1_PANCY|nr:phosphotransferase [Pantoea cypripedii]QGY33208.1 hypothetical protein CUN67_30330 [Pantoea cypripedii]